MDGDTVRVTFNIETRTKLDTAVVFDQASYMSRVITFFAVIETMLWVSLFLANITIIFIRVIFISMIGEDEGMPVISVPNHLW